MLQFSPNPQNQEEFHEDEMGEEGFGEASMISKFEDFDNWLWVITLN